MYKATFNEGTEDNTSYATYENESLTNVCDTVIAKATVKEDFEMLCPNYFKQVDGSWVKITGDDLITSNAKYTTWVASL